MKPNCHSIAIHNDVRRKLFSDHFSQNTFLLHTWYERQLFFNFTGIALQRRYNKNFSNSVYEFSELPLYTI